MTTTVVANPVDDANGFMQPLLKALQRHVDQSASIPGPNADSNRQRRRRIAAAWVYMPALVVWAEDHDLVDVQLRTALKAISGRFTTGCVRPVRFAGAEAAMP